MNIIELENVSCGMGGTDILKDISLAIPAGSFAGIAGPNGAGKSTLLRILCGLLPASGGNVRIKGKYLGLYSKSELALVISFLPAEIFIPYDFSVRDIVIMGRGPRMNWYGNISGKDELALARAANITGISPLLDRPVNSLSTGERQKVFLAQALVQEPEILVLDEPTSHLDINHQIEMLEVLRDENTGGMTIIMVSHNLALVNQYCSFAALMREGKIECRGKPGAVLNKETVAGIYGVKEENRHLISL